jgi:Tfp pilus assembly protein PilF
MSPVSLRKTAHTLQTPCALTLFALLLLASVVPNARAQAIGAHRGNVGGSGGNHTIQGRIISPLGKLPESRIRITIEHSDVGTLSTVAGDDGGFIFSNLEGGTYRVTIDAGKEFEIARESVYIENDKLSYNLPVYLRLKPEANPAMAGVPKPALDLFVKALEAGQKNENEKAMSLLAEAIKLHPDFALAHSELGLLLFKSGQLDKALEEYKVAIKGLPDDASIQLNYGIALLEKKDYGEAEKQLRRAAKKMDKSPQAHMYFGVALMRRKGADEAERARNFDEAEKEFQQSIKLGGDNVARAHYYLGGLYWAKQNFKKAADELETFLKLSPKAPDAEQIRATVKDLRSKS